jgi:Ni,Fe-hydrogenase III small subunit
VLRLLPRRQAAKLTYIKMKNRTKEIDDLFSTVHDFEIVGIKLHSETLRMEILLLRGIVQRRVAKSEAKVSN